jgi:hypothetical protein
MDMNVVSVQLDRTLTCSCTPPLTLMSMAPIGTKIMPTIRKAGITVEAVRIGCHAASFCCRKRVSGNVAL